MHENTEELKSIVPPQRLLCLRCGISWNSFLKRPKQCPRCKSAYWDRKARKRKGGKKE